ncbi:MAG: PhnA domain-containing protein [Campylobacteraceae bacterium]|nr:PhnA domain-containing protein [Campylobacteraceae bacterium]
MNLEQLKKRSSNKCELCGGEEELQAKKVEPREEYILTCKVCEEHLKDLAQNPNHWRCLNESIWSETPAIQAFSYRILEQIKENDFARDLLEIAYLEDDVLAWAKEGIQKSSNTKDSNGVTLNSGDSVSIIKDLEVKGAGFTAKRGTTVKNISLTDNDEQIEGRVNGVKIVLLSKFLKKI